MKNLKLVLTLAALVTLSGCVTTTGALVAGAAKDIATEHISPQLVLGAEAKCTSVIEAAQPGTLDPVKLAQIELLLEYMQMRHQRREFVAELRLEAELLCGTLDLYTSGEIVAAAATRRKAAIEDYRARTKGKADG